MKILFMGTPAIAAASLRALLQAGHTVCAVFTREDKPVGRKQVLTAPPVKLLALEKGIPVYQPKTLKGEESEETFRSFAPDLAVVVAYGRILPSALLTIPKYGAINLHVSKLPAYRGAAPIQWAVLNGEKETGVTVMYLNEGLDTGDIISMRPVSIGENETAGDLFERMEKIGAEELVKAVADIAAGRAERTLQNHAEATLAPPLTKEMARFTFTGPAEQLHHLVMGLNPWPVAFFEYQGKKIKVLRTKCCPGEGRPGELLCLNPLKVACGRGALELCQVQPEGGRPMEGSAWCLGRRLQKGDML